MLEDFTQLLWEAAEMKRVCRIRLEGEPMTRNVNPYGICQTSMNKIMLVCWQSMGFTKPGRTAGFRNLALDSIAEAEITELHFEKEESFNPKDPQYKDWVFHI
jgi:hypothetical protein